MAFLACCRSDGFVGGFFSSRHGFAGSFGLGCACFALRAARRFFVAAGERSLSQKWFQEGFEEGFDAPKFLALGICFDAFCRRLFECLAREEGLVKEGETLEEALGEAFEGEGKSSLDSKDLLSLVVEALEDKKGEDVVVLRLAGKADFADSMVIATGGSRRHLGALSEGVMRSVRNEGWSFLVEGEESDDWIVVDILHVVVHVFSREARARYDLESLWG